MKEFENVKIFTDDIDQETLNQIYEFQKSPLFTGVPIRIMPDTHSGKGACIGFTAPITDKLCPAIVGVDISCGMLVHELGSIDIDFERLDDVVHKYIPCGREISRRREEAVNLIKQLKCYKELKSLDRLEASLGTLGGGNHFCEIDTSEDGDKFLIIHSGSRNLGKQVADIYQHKAIRERKDRDNKSKEIITELKLQGRQSEIEATLKQIRQSTPSIPDDLCFVTGENLDNYLYDMRICQKFATFNRQIMANNILRMMKWKSIDSFTTLHNYIGEDNIIRKGAISAYKGEKVLIPLNMRDGSLICIGKGNKDWNYSAPHGAGRRLSRSQAKKQLSLEAYKEDMQGIYTTTVNSSTIDEAPAAYKPATEIMELIRDTVEIKEVIKPVYNFKASE